jgi:hypothetical protein
VSLLETGGDQVFHSHRFDISGNSGTSIAGIRSAPWEYVAVQDVTAVNIHVEEFSIFMTRDNESDPWQWGTERLHMLRPEP